MTEYTLGMQFQKLLTEEVANELLMGGKIIDEFLPNDKKMLNRSGFLLIEYSEPKKIKNDEREFYYAKYRIIGDGKPKFYLAMQYIKMRIKEVKKRAWKNR